MEVSRCAAVMAFKKNPEIDLLTVGHLNLDHEMKVRALPRVDRTVPVLRHDLFLGGTAGNVARWSAKLGLHSAVSAFIGMDFPAKFLEVLKKDGVDITRVVVKDGSMTPACWIARDRESRQITMIDQGAMNETGGEPLPDMKGVGWVHVATGDPVYQLRVARNARKLGISVSADPAQEVHYRWNPRDLKELLSLSEVLFVNSGELKQALSLLGLSSSEDLTQFVPLVVTTLGPDGAVATTRKGAVQCRAVRVQHPLGVTGAGDAFRAGFYAGWLRGEPLKSCLSMGCAAGALVVRSKRTLFLPSRSLVHR